MNEHFTGHRITDKGLHIQGEQHSVIVPMDEAMKLLSALQRLSNEPPQQGSERRQGHTSLQLHGGQITRRMKHG